MKYINIGVVAMPTLFKKYFDIYFKNYLKNILTYFIKLINFNYVNTLARMLR